MKKKYKAHFLMLSKVAKPFIVVWILNRLRDIVLYLSKKEISNVFLREVILLSLLFFAAVMTLKSYSLSFEKDFLIIRKGIVLKRSINIKLYNITSIRIIRRPINVFTKSTRLILGCETKNAEKKELDFTLKKEDAEGFIKMYKRHREAK